MQRIQCRVAPSLGELEDTPNNIWGTQDYINRYDPTVFFGLYDLRDYIALWRHKGYKWVLWAGSDLNNLVNGFVFNDGKLKWVSKLTARWVSIKKILAKADHYVENKDEWLKLQMLGINAKIVPSYLGEFPEISYEWKKNPQVYLSASEGRQEEYGWGIIEKDIAPKLPMVTFHLYGAEWFTKQKNIVCHGRISKDQMNLEIQYMQCGLRLNKSDGFSEITAKSVLMGQYPITYLEHPLIPHAQYTDELIGYLRSLTLMYEPNYKGREYYLKVLNKYPWNV